MLDPTGAAFWSKKRVLIVADPHFEKQQGLALRAGLAAQDTKALIERLNRLVRLYRPSRVIVLGQSPQEFMRLAKDDRARIEAMAREAQFIWVADNHEPAAHALPGQCATLHREGPFTFRHQACAQLAPREIEISGNFSPKASIDARGRRVSRPCFVADAQRLILPAFGSLTGNMDVREPSIFRLFPRGLRVFLLGQEQLFSFALEQLGRMAEVA
ncbi:metallophosphoesterase family protein [Acidocella aromatica]|uniref:Phosphoesterase n=1 Tax=Acidocella aromatica TaxID=1303579 RepID=A0A840V9G0_9PROT|nr:phosphoesterase [Acidocella aromatica]MBB5372376.1 hypothetical protein [Acidocella aromatica]